jgi:hypothetical protein
MQLRLRRTGSLTVMFIKTILKHWHYNSVADPDPGSKIRDPVLFTPWIQDPGSGSGINFPRIRDPG